MMNRSVKVGDRVRYAGWHLSRVNSHSIGTIVQILLDDYPFVVKWDDEPEDQRLDQFNGDQLSFVE